MNKNELIDILYEKLEELRNAKECLLEYLEVVRDDKRRISESDSKKYHDVFHIDYLTKKDEQVQRAGIAIGREISETKKMIEEAYVGDIPHRFE